MELKDMSLKERFARRTQAEREAWLAVQEPEVLEEIIRGAWWWEARPAQVPPGGDWFVFLALAGRGWGKSRAGAEWMVERAILYPLSTGGIPTEHLVVAETLSDARMICMEGDSGILNALTRRGMVRDVDYKYRQSPRPMVVFHNGVKIHCEGADDADVGRGHNLVSAWCVAAGEPVQTARGNVPIEQVAPGDLVVTSQGWAPVTHATMTRRDTELLRIETREGSLRVTPEHLVWTARGWMAAHDLQVSDTVATCLPQMTQWPANPPHTTSGTGRPGISSGNRATTPIATAPSSTGAYGPRPTGPSPMATKSTTSIGSDGTTGWQIWPSSNEGCIEGSPGQSEPIPTVSTLLPAASGLATAFGPCGPIGSPGRSSVTSADLYTSAPECGPSSAQTLAGRRPVPSMRLTPVLAVHKETRRADVYDLTVAGAHEFCAGTGGIKIHNCDEIIKWPAPMASYDEGIVPALRVDIADDQPRIFITTTPKANNALLRRFLKEAASDDPEVADAIRIVRGSTFENTSLSYQMVRALKNRYEGTAIGRQELYGEVLELDDGALFQATDIEACRVDRIPEGLRVISIAVGVDPAQVDDSGNVVDTVHKRKAGENHDEMGVVVVARTEDDDLWILADESIQAAGRPAAMHVWMTMLKWNASTVVYEANIGKSWMEQVFIDAYVELQKLGLMPAETTPPLYPVDAKLGKKTRAEPVAMRSQQHRLHLVGKFQRLEDQMTMFSSWESNKESPDRLDGMVHAARFHMKNERSAVRVHDPATLVRASRFDDGLGTGFDFRDWA